MNSVAVALVVVVAGVAGFLVWLRWRVRTEKPAEPGSPVVQPAGVVPGDCAGPCEVWHVVDRSYPRNRKAAGPFFVARCACEWVGDAHPDDNTAACELATADAYRHSSNVAPNVQHPLDQPS